MAIVLGININNVRVILAVVGEEMKKCSHSHW